MFIFHLALFTYHALANPLEASAEKTEIFAGEPKSTNNIFHQHTSARFVVLHKSCVNGENLQIGLMLFSLTRNGGLRVPSNSVLCVFREHVLQKFCSFESHQKASHLIVVSPLSAADSLNVLFGCPKMRHSLMSNPRKNNKYNHYANMHWKNIDTERENRENFSNLFQMKISLCVFIFIQINSTFLVCSTAQLDVYVFPGVLAVCIPLACLSKTLYSRSSRAAAIVENVCRVCSECTSND